MTDLHGKTGEAQRALKRMLANGPHVTLRRMMCDARLLVRTRSGSTYSVNAEKAAEIASVAPIAPAEMLLAVRDDRARRKQEHRA